MRNFKLLAVAVGLLWALVGCGLDNNPISSSDMGVRETGSAEITVVLGKVGMLGKIRTIELENVIFELSAPGEKTLKDTINVSGLANSSANSKCGKKYDSLASLLKTWTIQAVAYDKKGNVIHRGCTKFIVPARETVPVTLNLDADYSILKALFLPIRDSVTRVVLAVDGVPVDDSTFAKQSILGDSVMLSFEYLKVGVAQKVSLLAYGTMWGFDTLLYRGDTTVTPKAGVDTRYDVTLQWVGPSLPPGGISTMQVTLGDVGTTYINGWLEEKQVISLRGMTDNGLIASYPFSGNTNDVSGNGFNAEAFNGVTLTSDRFGHADSAYQFDGDRGYLSATINAQSDVSVSLWMNSEACVNWYPYIITIDGVEFICQLGNHPDYQDRGWTGALQNSYQKISSPVPYDEWHHVVMTYDNVTKNNSVYVDGVLVGSLIATNPIPQGQVLIGNTTTGLASDGGAGFKGKLDDIKIYNRVITQSEITALFTATE